MNPDTPSFVAVGHVTWDYSPGTYEERQPGGAVAFASTTAQALGVNAAIITSSEGDYPFGEVLHERGQVVNIRSADTSTFENVYDPEGNRAQRLLARGGDIELANVPGSWLSPEMLYVGPLTQELPVDCLKWWSPRVSCVVPQGWLRSWDEPLPSRISVDPAPPPRMSDGWDICIVSDSEVGENSLHDWRRVARMLIVTHGSQGSRLYTSDDKDGFEIESYASFVENAGRDTTGAGDVFAAAMLITYAETGDPVESARFASAAAALSTAEASWRGVRGRCEVDALLRSSGH